MALNVGRKHQRTDGFRQSMGGEEYEGWKKDVVGVEVSKPRLKSEAANFISFISQARDKCCSSLSCQDR